MSVFITKGLGSGRPNAGPKPKSVIMGSSKWATHAYLDATDSIVSAVETAMRRADRLFRIIQILRRARRPVTALVIAEEVETSPRTIYRDMAQLMADRVPIRGEAGTGYVLDGGFDMPPLMLTPDEIEAAMLGAQWVRSQGDPQLARAAADLVAKIGAVIPEHLRPILMEPSLTSFSMRPKVADTVDMARVRAAIRTQG